jgi:glycosyltransferase involved in cell wall biosynthesis
MSKFGQGRLEAAGLDAEYVPHAIDTKVFRPFDKGAARKVVNELGLVQDSHGVHVPIPDDAFVVGMNAANKGTTPARKAFPQVLDAFSGFAAKHTDAVLYLHTEQFGTHQGLKLIELVVSMGLGDRVFWTDQYAYRIGIIPEHVSLIYSCMDVLANPSYGEGFGLPIIEAQACGVPVIVNGFSSMPELCGAGWETSGERYWHEGQYSWWQIPSVKSIGSAFEQAYKTAGRFGEKARRFALQYDTDTIYTTFWKPLLGRLEERIGLVTVGDIPTVDLTSVEL